MPFLDRIGAPFTSTFRPQEAFSTQALDAAVRALNRERPQAVFVTGDITDNAQRNELTLALATLRGQTRRPRQRRHGLRRRAGRRLRRPLLLPPRPRRARPPRRARSRPSGRSRPQGSNAPWYPLVGNHDVLAQGEVPPTPAIDAFATGDRLVPSLDPELAAAARRGRRPSRPSPRCSRTRSRSTRSTSPPTPSAGSTRPARPSDALGHATWTTRSTSARRAGDPGRHRQPRRHLAAPASTRRSSSGCGSNSTQPATAGSSSSPTTR